MGGRKEKRISLSPRRSPRRVMNDSPPSPRAFSPAVLRGVGPLCFPVEGRVFGAGRGSSGESLTSPNQPAGTPLPGRLPGNTGELPRPATAGAEPALPPSRGSLGGEGGYHYLPVPPPTRRIPLPALPPSRVRGTSERGVEERWAGTASLLLAHLRPRRARRGPVRLGTARGGWERGRDSSETVGSRGKGAGRGRRVAVPGRDGEHKLVQHPPRTNTSFSRLDKKE